MSRRGVSQKFCIVYLKVFESFYFCVQQQSFAVIEFLNLILFLQSMQ